MKTKFRWIYTSIVIIIFFLLVTTIAKNAQAQTFSQLTPPPYASQYIYGLSFAEYPAPFAIDWNDDGAMDFLVGELSGNISLLLNNGSDQFTTISNFGNLSLPSNSMSAPSAIDYNHDGDLDLIIGFADGSMEIFLNNGNDTFTQDTTNNLNQTNLNVGMNAVPYPVDWHPTQGSDGDIDLIVGAADGSISYFVNLNGNGFFAPNNELGVKSTIT